MSTNKTKIDLVTTICGKMRHAGVRDEDGNIFSIEYGTGKSLLYLPIGNLQNIAKDCVNPGDSIDKILQGWGRASMLSFTPYIIKKKTRGNEFPILVLKRNKFLQLHKNRFMLFESEEHVGLISNSSDSIHFLICSDPYMKDSKIGYMLWWASLVDCAYSNPAFRATLKGNREIIEEFLHSTMTCVGWNPQYTLDTVYERISNVRGNLDIFSGTVYQLTDIEGIKCRFKIYDSCICVETARNNLTIMSLPADSEGIYRDKDDMIDRELLLDYRQVLEEARYRNILLQFVLRHKMIVFNYAKWSAMETLKTMYSANSSCVHDISTMKELITIQDSAKRQY